MFTSLHHTNMCMHMSVPHPPTIGHCLKEPSLSFLLCCFYIMLQRDPQGQVLKSLYSKKCASLTAFLMTEAHASNGGGGGLSLGKLDVR